MIPHALLSLALAPLALSATTPLHPLTHDQQKPLASSSSSSSSSLTSAAPTKVQHDGSVCDAGSSSWSGVVPLGTPGRRMFYWYFESRSDPATDPLIIWLSGGPGGSSLLGAFFENVGPCKVSDDGVNATRSENSWTNDANVLFLDQPVGVGLSTSSDPTLWAADLNEAAMDIDKVLDAFFEMFPALVERPLHFAGESFAGMYVTTYATLMRRHVDSIVLVDADVDFMRINLGVYEHMCLPGARRKLTAAQCARLEQLYPGCDRAGRACQATYDEATCGTAKEECYRMIELIQDLAVPGGWDMYDDRLECTVPLTCGNIGLEQVTRLFNSSDVQERLGVSPAVDFSSVGERFNMQFSNLSSIYVPRTREVARLLDEKGTRVLVVNGNNDIIVSSEGIVRLYDDLPWDGRAAFLVKDYKPWYYTSRDGNEKKQGGTYKTAGNLAVVLFDEAGHMVPHSQPVAVEHVIRQWTRGELE